jgi:hypothetical protein
MLENVSAIATGSEHFIQSAGRIRGLHRQYFRTRKERRFLRQLLDRGRSRARPLLLFRNKRTTLQDLFCSKRSPADSQSHIVKSGCQWCNDRYLLTLYAEVCCPKQNQESRCETVQNHRPRESIASSISPPSFAFGKERETETPIEQVRFGRQY